MAQKLFFLSAQHWKTSALIVLHRLVPTAAINLAYTGNHHPGPIEDERASQVNWAALIAMIRLITPPITSLPPNRALHLSKIRSAQAIIKSLRAGQGIRSHFVRRATTSQV